MFSYVHRETTTCHQCHIFDGKRKLVPLPLNPISVEEPFQQWGLDFIGEINPNYLGQHRWILTKTDYFTKWIEAIPKRRATNAVIMDFQEENILARFGCPKRIVTDNAPDFKSNKMMGVFVTSIILISIILLHTTHGVMDWLNIQTKA